jgi:cytochrome P450 family 710 subfamily A protein
MNLLAFTQWSWQNWLFLAVSAIFFFALLEQISLWRKRKWLPGPLFTWPFVGGIFEMVLNPYTFWDQQENYGSLSWNSLFGRFFVFSRDTETSIKIFKNNSPDALRIVLHPNAVRLLGEGNIAFMQGEKHKELRKRLLPLFTKKALGLYVRLQEKAIREHFDKWIKMKGPIEMRPLVRDLNVETSQTVFVGPYLDEDQRKEFANNYRMMNEGFLAFPISLPGTTLWKAIRARKNVVATLAECARRSKLRMAEKKGEPECLLDFWMQNTVQEIKEAKEAGLPAPPHSTDYEIACTTLDFLFASQDASTASLTWTCALCLTDHPEILTRVRAEQHKLRPNGEAITPELLAQMTYTNQVMLEILRYRPPATLVPHVALQDFELSENYKVPKGSFVIPSVWGACHQGFSNPFEYDPDRWSPERGEEKKHGKNFLVFGSGPHYCMGKQYALNHLMTFLAIMSTSCEMKRHRTPTSDSIVYGPTIFPGDGVIVTIEPKEFAETKPVETN